MASSNTTFGYNSDIPSDYQGVLFEPLDNKDNWKFSLAKELKEAKFEIDLNKVQRIRIDRVSVANHDLIHWLDKPGIEAGSS